MMALLPNIISKLCYDCFEKLPKKGKPQKNREWTLLAAIVLEFDDKKYKVVALSTGTKCLGESQLSLQGDVISDSHAEVLARRAFLRYLYHHMSLVLENKISEVLYLDNTTKKFFLKSQIKIYFFISHVPCGDAAIFPKNMDNCEILSDLPPEAKRQKIEHMEDSFYSKFDDIYRTGAKCVNEGLQDAKVPGKDYHTIGALRTKPGRGVPTLSMSCSDKIAVWNVCGLQGALLSHFLHCPLYVTAFILGKCPFSKEAFERAVVGRISEVNNLPETYVLNKPSVLQSSLEFPFSKENITKINKKAVPCPSSIIWSDIPDGLDVSVNGKKQGVTKKDLGKPTSRVYVCRNVLITKFLQLYKKMVSIHAMYEVLAEKRTYSEFKKSSVAYKKAKEAVFKIFTGWTQKPENLQDFICNNTE